MADAIKVVGLEQVQKNLVAATKRYETGLRSALYRLGVQIARSAAMRAPSVSGALRESAYCTEPDQHGDVEVGFGAPYAALEENDLQLEHRHGGAGNFLRNAQNEAMAGGLAKLGQWTKEAAEGGGGLGSSQGVSSRPKFNASKHGAAQVLSDARKK